MEIIQVPLAHPYNVIVQEGLLESVGRYVEKLAPTASKIAIISDSTVFPLYGNTVMQSFSQTEINPIHFVFPAGEASKSKDVLFQILEWLSEHHITRKDVILALGGGVSGDLAGFAASVYLRGIPYIQVPTTLLAAVDSSVGGKTGINLPQGKNLVGSFWQPLGVFCDTKTFDTLPSAVFSDGIAEIIKYACIWDVDFFRQLENTNWLSHNLTSAIARCVSIKAEIVSQDEREEGRRQILNFGHTLGHAVEKASNYSVSHGMGVAIGMAYMAKAGETKGITARNTSLQLIKLLEQYQLPTSTSYPLEILLQHSLGDKKRRGDILHVVLLQDIGIPLLHPVKIKDYPLFLEGGNSWT